MNREPPGERRGAPRRALARKEPSMGVHVEKEREGVWALHLTGTLHKEELDAIQGASLRVLEGGAGLRMLVDLHEGFAGWAKGEAWGDTAFFSEYGDRIVKIAVVGPERWADEMLMFLGAGLRKAPVKFFPAGERDAALDWLV